MKLKSLLLTAAIIGAGVTWSVAPARASNVPTGEYVLDSYWGDSSEAINDEQINASSSQSGDSGSVSISVQDDFYAGDGYDMISRNAGAWASFGKTYKWETPNGAPPAPYSFTTNINYSGTCTATESDGLQGSWSSDVQGGQIAPGDSSNVSQTATYDSDEGYQYIGTGLSLSVSSSLNMSAHQSSVSGSLSQTLSGSIDDPVY